MKLIDKLTGAAIAVPPGTADPPPGATVPPEATLPPEATVPLEATVSRATPEPSGDGELEVLRAEAAALREETVALRARLANAENRGSAPPSPPTGGEGEFYSPDDVRRMSAAEVRTRMSMIRASMEKWKS